MELLGELELYSNNTQTIIFAITGVIILILIIIIISIIVVVTKNLKKKKAAMKDIEMVNVHEDDEYYSDEYYSDYSDTASS